VILDLVDQGLLTLDSKPSELISYWTGESAVTLRHLLAFTSGFIEEPSCLKLGIGTSNFEQCVRNVYDGNIGTAAAPGTQFYYSSAHLQIAGQMALIASGATSWTAVFDAFKARTGLFPTSVYNLPSTSNPRLAGGMTWTGAEYLDFLRALFKGTLLSPTLRAELLANQRGSASVAKSPCLEGLGEDWAYGLGNWLECASAKQADSFDCGAGHRNSSPGAYGAYPFIDFDDRYFGILARKGALGTHPEGVRLFRSVQDLAGRWARGACGP
jgi:CubicO group peptidase (beta-lactamase class C family)